MEENNQENKPETSQQTDRIVPRLIEAEMKQSYVNYAMSVIVGRALPDVRDGLKPVHRRILFAMHDMGMLHNKPFKKSARIVGEVIGKYIETNKNILKSISYSPDLAFSLKNLLVICS